MPGTISPWPSVQTGNQGHPVRTLQWLLRAQGRYVAVDGVFGPATEHAVKVFQSSVELSPVGIVTPQTWAAVVIQVKKGSTGDAVRAVQENFSFAQVNPARGFRWTKSLDRKRTVRCGAFSMLYRSRFHR